MRSQLIKIKQYGAKSREITPYLPKWHDVNQNYGNPTFLKIIKLTLVYQDIEKWSNIVRTQLTKSTKMNSEIYWNWPKWRKGKVKGYIRGVGIS